MESPEKMFSWDEEWNISFAGCGFRSVYYLGALSCILQQVPQLVHGASKICGASSGCLVAAALAVGIPIEEFCIDVLTTAKEARRHTLGVFHPTFSLLRTVRDFLLEKLPADAHLRASGKLCVSLTRLSDGQNVLVSEFDSREELIQVLMCSCFFPVYCGFSPPSYRGVWYMDGALSNNMPLFEQRNTITMAPFSGESDICPKEGTFNFFEVHYGNVSIQVNTGNVHRVCTSFLPPRLEKLAEICHNGYMDALRFLSERDLLGRQHVPPRMMEEAPCCELVELAQAGQSKRKLLNGQNPHREDHWWLDPKRIRNLPVGLNRVFCEACRESHDGSKFPPVKVLMNLLTLLMLPIELIVLLSKSMVLSSCTAVCRLLSSTADLCRQMWRRSCEEPNSASSEQTCNNRSSNSDLSSRKNTEPLTSTINTNSVRALHLDNNFNLNLFSITSAYGGVPKSNLLSHKAPACGQMTLNHRSKTALHQT